MFSIVTKLSLRSFFSFASSFASSFAFAMIPLSSLAIETDQYLVWKSSRDIEDSTSKINEYLNVEIDRVLKSINKRHNEEHTPIPSCHEVRTHILKHLNKFFGLALINRVGYETWNDRDIEKIGSLRFKILNNNRSSIYKRNLSLRIFPLGATIKNNGVYFGFDKLDHFFSLGEKYLELFEDGKKKGLSDEEAINTAIDYGIETEMTFFGYKSSGVFSLADLEANYQGLIFARQLCENTTDSNNGVHLLLGEQDESWRLSKKFDITPFVNPYWDESFNLSHYKRSTFKSVKRELLKLCKLLHSPKVVAIKEYYKTFEKSYGQSHIEDLIKNKQILYRGLPPDTSTQSLEYLCQQQQQQQENNVDVNINSAINSNSCDQEKQKRLREQLNKIDLAV